MTIPLIRARANPNQELYVRALSSIYRYGFRIYDPDFALAQEPDPYEKCRKDPVVAQAIDIRLHGVAGRRWRVMPAGREKQDRELAMIVEDAIGTIIGFSEARYELAQAVIRARSYAYIQGRRQRVRLGDAPAAKWWVPLSLKDIDRRRFRYVPMNNLMDSAPDSFPDAYTERTSPVNRKQVKEPFDVIPNTWGGKNIGVQLQLFSVARNRWERMVHPEYLLNLTYNDSEMRLGYGRGLMESIYYYLWAKTTLIKEGLQGVEKWARGLWTVKIDGLRDASTGKPNDAVRDAWLEVMQDFQSRHVGAFDSKDEIDIIEGGGTGNTIIMDFIRYLDDAIRAVILGSSLPFGGGKGAGSYARAKEEGDVHESLIQFDRDKLDEEITRSLIGLFLRLNRKNILALGLGDARTPYFSVVQERMEDPSQSANVLSVMSSIGMKVREDEAYRKLGFTPPTEEDRVLDLAPAQMGGEEEFVEGEEEGFEEEEEAEEASQEDIDEELGKLDDLEDKVENLSDEVTVYLNSYRHHFCRDHNVSLEMFDRITMQGTPPRTGGPPPEWKGPDKRIKNPKWDSHARRWVSADKDDDKGKRKPPPGAEPIEVGGPGQGPDIESARTKIKEVTDLVDNLTKQVESGDLNKREMKAGKDKVLEEIKAIRNMLGGGERVNPMQDPSHPMHIKEVTPEFREKKAEISDELLAGQNKALEGTVKELTGTLKEMKKEGAPAEDISSLEHGLNQAKSDLKEGGLLAAERAGEAAGKKKETIEKEKEEKKQAAAQRAQEQSTRQAKQDKIKKKDRKSKRKREKAADESKRVAGEAKAAREAEQDKEKKEDRERRHTREDASDARRDAADAKKAADAETKAKEVAAEKEKRLKEKAYKNKERLSKKAIREIGLQPQQGVSGKEKAQIDYEEAKRRHDEAQEAAGEPGMDPEKGAARVAPPTPPSGEIPEPEPETAPEVDESEPEYGEPGYEYGSREPTDEDDDAEGGAPEPAKPPPTEGGPPSTETPPSGGDRSSEESKLPHDRDWKGASEETREEWRQEAETRWKGLSKEQKLEVKAEIVAKVRGGELTARQAALRYMGSPKGGAKSSVANWVRAEKAKEKEAGKPSEKKAPKKKVKAEKKKGDDFEKKEQSFLEEEEHAAHEVDQLGKDLEETEATIEALIADKPIRPKRAKPGSTKVDRMLSNPQISDVMIKRIAEEVGEDHTKPDWYDGIDPNLIDETLKGLGQAVKEPTVSGLKKEAATLRRQIKEAEKVQKSASKKRRSELNVPFSAIQRKRRRRGKKR